VRHKTGKLASLTLFVLIFGLTAMVCSRQSGPELKSLVNFSHLDRLYEEVVINDQEIGIVHIYSDFPEYQWTDAPGEGTACVDDVARAAVLYLRHYHYTRDQHSLERSKKLLDFIRFMQAPNGLFYNFIYRDLSINKTRSNSQPLADWWTWRALWAMGEGLLYIADNDSAYRIKLLSGFEKALPAIDSLLQSDPGAEVGSVSGLPFGAAADQAAVLQLALLDYYRYKTSPRVSNFIDKLAGGIMEMQKGSSDRFPYCAFLSWRDTWHAWGNCQAYALLNTGSMLSRMSCTNAGLDEVRYFHPYLINRNQLAEFSVREQEGKLTAYNENQFPQIAYGIRPQVWAGLAASRITEDIHYARQAAEIACWLFGKNAADELLYDPETGRCFDGLDADKKINRNSGAESTLEALLTMIEIEQSPEAHKIVYDFYRSREVH
jgi:hypothetical protein